MREAITRVYSVIAVWRPTTVVSRSATTCEIDTFITVVSSTMMNCAEASRPTTPQPAFAAVFVADFGAVSVMAAPAPKEPRPAGAQPRADPWRPAGRADHG